MAVSNEIDFEMNIKSSGSDTIVTVEITVQDPAVIYTLSVFIILVQNNNWIWAQNTSKNHLK